MLAYTHSLKFLLAAAVVLANSELAVNGFCPSIHSATRFSRGASSRLYASDDKSLFDRLGGEDAIAATVDGMYERILADDLLKEFFDGTDMEAQKGHQRIFLTTAFGGMEPKMDIAEYISTSHANSFDSGLNEHHFDAVAGHVVATLESLKVSQDLIDEVVEVVSPLRPLFEKK